METKLLLAGVQGVGAKPYNLSETLCKELRGDWECSFLYIHIPKYLHPCDSMCVAPINTTIKKVLALTHTLSGILTDNTVLFCTNTAEVAIKVLYNNRYEALQRNLTKVGEKAT